MLDVSNDNIDDGHERMISMNTSETATVCYSIPDDLDECDEPPVFEYEFTRHELLTMELGEFIN